MGRRLSSRPLGVAAAALVAFEALLSALGGRTPILSLLALGLAPGLALVPLLPERARVSVTSVVAAAPSLAFAAASVVLISLASAGMALDGTGVRVALGAIVVLGLLLPGDEPGRPRPGETRAAAGLLLALAAGSLLQQRVIGGAPVPGNDWAKYLLYADEIRTHGSLLIDNPYWMLGVPFREDPGAPSLYGGYLALTGEPASVLVHGIWPFAAAAILSMFAFVRAFWGDAAGVLAAVLIAVLPISQDILAWHGLANLAAIALLPVLLLYLTSLTTEGLSPLQAAGFGLLVVALAATHRLSFVVALLSIVTALAVSLSTGNWRRILRGASLAVLAAVVLAPGVAYDLIERGHSFGGAQSYRAYLSAKVELGPLVGDLSVPFALAALGALALAVRWSRRDRPLVPLLCLLAAVVALAYAWLIHIPVAYFRMAYFLPLALAPLVAIALVRLLPSRTAGLAGGALAAVIAALAWVQAGNVRDFYAFASPASLRGLDAVASSLRPSEVVVTDRCWSFLATWLLRTRTLPALEPEDIQPRAELSRARLARAVLDGTPAGSEVARRLGIRYLIVDPTCTDARERPTRPPLVGTPVYLSKRLVVLRLPGDVGRRARATRLSPKGGRQRSSIGRHTRRRAS